MVPLSEPRRVGVVPRIRIDPIVHVPPKRRQNDVKMPLKYRLNGPSNGPSYHLDARGPAAKRPPIPVPIPITPPTLRSPPTPPRLPRASGISGDLPRKSLSSALTASASRVMNPGLEGSLWAMDLDAGA